MRAARLVLSDHGVGLFAAEGAQAIVAVRRVSARTACSRCGTDLGAHVRVGMALAPRLPLYLSSGTPADSVVSRGSRHKNLRPDRCRQRPESRCHELKTVQKVLGSRPLQVLQWNRGLNRTFMMGENLGSDLLSPATSVGCPSLATVGVPSSRTEGAANNEDFINSESAFQ